MFTEIKNTGKLLQLLGSFSKKERLYFRDFLASPYFNKRRDVIQLYDILNARANIDNNVSTKKIIPKLFPELYNKSKEAISPSDYPRLRNAMTALTRHAEDFIMQEAKKRKEKNLENDRLLIDELMLRKLYEHAQSVLKKRTKQRDKKTPINRIYYLEEFRLKEARFYLGILRQNRSLKNSIQPVVQSFHYYYLCNILLYCCATLNQAKVLGIEYDEAFIEGVEQLVKENVANIPPLAEIYYYILMVLKEQESKSYFLKAKALIEEKKQDFDSTEVRQMCNLLLNFCNDEVRSGRMEFRQFAHTIYEENITTGIWDKGLYFSSHIFNNYISNALDVKREGIVMKIENFIKEYKEKLDPSIRETILNLSYARLAYAKEDFDKATKHLKTIDKKEDFLYKSYVKTINIKILYSQNHDKTFEERETIGKAIDAFRAYLTPDRSPTMNEQNRKANLKFCSITKRLLSYQEDPNKRVKIIDLNEEAKKAPILEEREWLLKITS